MAKYFWLCLPDETTGSPTEATRFDSLQAAVKQWVDWVGSYGQDVLNRQEVAMRKISMLDVKRPPAWNLKDLKEDLTAYFYTNADPEYQEMVVDEDKLDWKLPGDPVPVDRVLQVAGELPGAIERLRLVRQHVELLERIEAVQEDEWFSHQAVAAKIRWYKQRGEQGPETPAFSYERLRAGDMRCPGPLTPAFGWLH